MPLQKLQYRPGVNREGTNYSNEGGFYECDKIRFRSGYPEKIGGWQSISNPLTYTYYGVARSMWNWVALDASNLNGVGTNEKLYVENGGQYFDVTPLNGGPVALGANPIATTSGSYLVTITAAAHGASPGTWVTFSGATAVGGLTINGAYEIITTPSANTYTIIAASTASSTATGGGAAVQAQYQINAGLAVYTVGNGWGVSSWGSGGWGAGTSTTSGGQFRLWTLDNFGQDMLAAPRGSSIYYWAKDTVTYAPAVTLSSASTAAGFSGSYVPNQTLQIFVSAAQRFAIAFGANPYVAGSPSTTFDPMLVRWSDQENAFDWVPTTTNQAGELRLSNGSTIITAVHGRQENLIYTDSSLFVMQYIGPPYVWKFNLIEGNLSIISAQSAVTVNNVTYWMGMDKFYSYSGTVATLPCSLRQFVFDNINMSQAYQVIAGTNEGYNEVWWHYPSANSMVNDTYVIYNYLENTWYYGYLHRTAWLDSPLRSYPMAASSVQNSYINTAISSSVTAISLVNAFSYPNTGTIQIDSELISYTSNDGNTLSGCTRGVLGTTAASHIQYSAATFYDVPNQVMYHELGVDDGSRPVAVALSSYITSSDFDIADGDRFSFVWRMLPDVTFNGSKVDSPKLYMQLKPRQNSGTPYTYATIDTVNSTDNFSTRPYYIVESYTGQVYTRLRGRQMAFKISSADLGVTWQLGVPRIDIRADGRR